MSSRERLSATVESEALAAGRSAVAAGLAPSLSAWVNTALLRQADLDKRLAAMDRLLADYEAEHGPITDAEIQAAERATRARAHIVRPAGFA